MNLGISDRVRPLLDAVRTFITDRVLPVEEEFLEEVGKGGIGEGVHAGDRGGVGGRCGAGHDLGGSRRVDALEIVRLRPVVCGDTR